MGILVLFNICKEVEVLFWRPFRIYKLASIEVVAVSYDLVALKAALGTSLWQHKNSFWAEPHLYEHTAGLQGTAAEVTLCKNHLFHSFKAVKIHIHIYLDICMWLISWLMEPGGPMSHSIEHSNKPYPEPNHSNSSHWYRFV